MQVKEGAIQLQVGSMGSMIRWSLSPQSISRCINIHRLSQLMLYAFLDLFLSCESCIISFLSFSVFFFIIIKIGLNIQGQSNFTLQTIVHWTTQTVLSSCFSVVFVMHATEVLPCYLCPKRLAERCYAWPTVLFIFEKQAEACQAPQLSRLSLAVSLFSCCVLSPDFRVDSSRYKKYRVTAVLILNVAFLQVVRLDNIIVI